MAWPSGQQPKQPPPVDQNQNQEACLYLSIIYLPVYLILAQAQAKSPQVPNMFPPFLLYKKVTQSQKPAIYNIDQPHAQRGALQIARLRLARRGPCIY